MTISQLERFKCRPEVRQGGLPAYISPVSEGPGGTSLGAGSPSSTSRLAMRHAEARSCHTGRNHSSAAPSYLPILLRAGSRASRGPVHTYARTHARTHGARGLKSGLVGALALLRVPSLVQALPGAALALPECDRPANSPSLPQPPSRTDLDLNTIIHFSHKQLQRVTGHPRIFFPALLQVTAHRSGAAWEGRAACYPFSLFPTLGIFQRCPVMSASSV